MSEFDLQAIASRRVVYTMPDEKRVTVRRDHTYAAADGTTQAMDIYYPPGGGSERGIPAVVLVTGYADAGVRRVFGRPAKDIGSNVSWATLLASSGMAAVTYVNTNPAQDAALVLDDLRTNASALGIDSTRVGIWSCSGNVPSALSLLMNHGREVSCAAFLYACTLDRAGSTFVADMAKTFRFANPTEGRAVEELPPVPMWFARAGRDEMPGLNTALDAFIADALAANRPITVVNYPPGPHAFDAVDDSSDSKRVIRDGLYFLSTRLRE